MINPTVETDLVGDLVEITDVYYSTGVGQRETVARGRIRAVTSKVGELTVWIEVIDEACREAFRGGVGHDRVELPQIGDIEVVSIPAMQEHTSYRMRLLRGQS